MKAVKALGLIFALAMIPLAVLQVSNLQDQGESLANNVGTFLNSFTAIFTILMVGIGVMALVFFVSWFTHRAR